MDPLEKLTLKALLQRTVGLFGDRPALGPVDGEPMTYAEFGQKVAEISEFLFSRGITTGDRVAILSENQPNWGIAYFAVTTMGAIAVPIFPEFVTNAVQHILRHANCKAIFVSERLYDKLADCQCDALTTVVLMDDFSLIPPETKKDGLREVVRERTKEFAIAALRMTGRNQTEVQEDDVALIIYTSGTTGHSKGVILTHKSIVFDAQATTSMVKVTEQDRLLSILPLSHTFESTVGLVCPVMYGASIYYLDKPPSARILLSAMAKVKPTIMLSVPLVIEKIYKMRILPQMNRNALIRLLSKMAPVRKQLHKVAGKKLLQAFGGDFRLMAIGGAALSPDVETFLREAGFPYTVGYGLTETGPVVTGVNSPETKYRSSGRPLPGVEVKIDDPHPETGEGEILVRGPNVMQGYYKDPERTQEVLIEAGWFKTGDLGVLDEDQFLYIKGRLKNLILGPSGENIYPEEVETVLNMSDYVLESLVFQPQPGQLAARVYLNYEKLEAEAVSHKLSESQTEQRINELLEDLRQQVNASVPRFARLNKIIEQTEPFEKTPTQKVKRYLYVN